MEIEGKQALDANPAMLSATDLLKGMLRPPMPKLKTPPKMKLISNNGELLGDGKVTKAQEGTVLNPYGSKKTRGLNPHKVMMGQGSGMMGGGNVKRLEKNPKKDAFKDK